MGCACFPSGFSATWPTQTTIQLKARIVQMFIFAIWNYLFGRIILQSKQMQPCAIISPGFVSQWPHPCCSSREGNIWFCWSNGSQPSLPLPFPHYKVWPICSLEIFAQSQGVFMLKYVTVWSRSQPTRKLPIKTFWAIWYTIPVL